MELVEFRYSLVSRGYEQIHGDSNVTVYRRRGAATVDLAADGRFAASPEKVRVVLLGYEHHARFIKNVAESRVLARGKSELIVYQRLRLPVISDRDYTLLVTWGTSLGGLWMKFTCANHRGPPPRGGVVRLALHDGGWLLAPVLGGTRARYQGQLDLGGSLPRWMARSGAGREVPGMFADIARQLR